MLPVSLYPSFSSVPQRALHKLSHIPLPARAAEERHPPWCLFGPSSAILYTVPPTSLYRIANASRSMDSRREIRSTIPISGTFDPKTDRSWDGKTRAGFRFFGSSRAVCQERPGVSQRLFFQSPSGRLRLVPAETTGHGS